MGSDLFGDFVRRRRRYLVRRLREAGFVIVGKTSMPEMGILPDHRAAPVRPDPQPVGPRAHPGRLERRRRPRRSRPGWCRWRTATTAAARSGSPPPAAGWSGSSRRAGGCRSAPTAGDSFLVCDGVLTRTVADTARRARRAGRAPSPGDATWAPPPPAAVRRAGRASSRAGCGSALALDAAARRTRRSIRSASGPRATRRRCSSRSATTSRRSSRRGRAWTCCPTSPRVVRPAGLVHDLARRRSSPGASRPPSDVEPLTWVLWEHAQHSGHDRRT